MSGGTGSTPHVLVTVALPLTVARVHGAWVAHMANGGDWFIISHRIGFALPNRYMTLDEASVVARKLVRYARNITSLRQWKAQPVATIRRIIRAAVIRAGGHR